MKRSEQIIMDNGGGITLQLQQGRYRWQHTYSDPVHAGEDLVAWLAGSDLTQWDGNDLDDDDVCWLVPSQDDIRNGGYRVYGALELFSADVDQVWGAAGRDMWEALHPYTGSRTTA